MPFTPIHFGPGAAIKAVAPKHFSFTIYCFAQIITDFETAYYMVEDMYPWHRFFHTYIGATLVAAFSILIGRPLCQFVLRIWSSWAIAPFNRFYPTTAVIPMRSAVSGAFIGTYSHVLLDSIMHSDTAPFAPFSTTNSLFGLINFSALHAGCILLGIFGAFSIAWNNRQR